MPRLQVLPEIESVVADDSTLIGLTREGDESAYEQLYARHRAPGLNYAMSLGSSGGASGAEDLLAEAFARMLVVLRRGGGPADKFRPYLFSTVRNIHVDHVRRASRAPAAVPPRSTSAVEGMLSDEFNVAYSKLSVRWRLVLWLRDVEQLPLEDAAVLLELTPNATAALHFRARRALRDACRAS